jgi:hypothetical protein
VLYSENITTLLRLTKRNELRALAQDVLGDPKIEGKSIFWALHLVAKARRENYL